MAENAEYCSLMPITWPIADEINSGPPISPISGMTRGTRRDW